jgi:hypothetical protein
LEEYTMTTFVHVDQPLSHPGVRRAEGFAEQLRLARKHFDSARGLAAVLLAAIVAALLVVADRVVSTLDDGGAIVAWAVLWAVAFVGLALFASTARSVAIRAKRAWRAGAERRAIARADAQFMAYAQFDPRVMHELQAAKSRAEAQTEAAAAPVVARKKAAADGIPSLYDATRRVKMAYYY